jgi:c-di-AMP phosphodiesterase-like protein
LKRLFNVQSLPIFFQNSKLGTVAFLLLAVSLISVFFAMALNVYFGLVWLLITVIGLVYSTRALQEVNDDTQAYLSGLSYRISRTEQEALIRMPIGILLLDAEQKVEWLNPYLQQYFGTRNLIGQTLPEIDQELADEITQYNNAKTTNTIRWGDKSFSIYVQRNLRVVYLMDVTDYATIQSAYEQQRLIFGLTSIDNYEEVADGMSESEAAALRTYITKTLGDWAVEHGLYLRRLNAERYVFFGYRSSLDAIEHEKFPILKVIRETTAQQNAPLTLSMGIAYGQDDINQLANLAQTNLDLALGRGGDQVVVKAADETARFYGGATNPMAKRTRVRARVISQALGEIVEQVDQVMIVGHKTPDLDSLGAALGIWRFAQTKQRPAYVIFTDDKPYHDIALLLDEIQQLPDVPDAPSGTQLKDAIIDEKQALKLASDRTLLVLVDHGRPSLTPAPDLLEKLQARVVILDHHRRSEEDFAEKPLLSYVEPYASSTAELVVELLQYQDLKAAPLTKLEATALLGGMQIDTKNFTLRTGSRTFDAASYLRANGADNELIQAFMKEPLEDYQRRNHLVSRVTVDNENAIVVGEEDQVYDSVLTAQAADELLQMIGVEASYVITRRADGKVGVSARSTGQRNVQIVMEQMGGGGHLLQAATQIEGQSLSEVRDQLLELLHEQTQD